MNHSAKIVYAVCMSIVTLTIMTGCAKKPFLAKSLTPPPIIYCFDTIGHIAGNKPYILGGTCLCTPNHKNVCIWQADGYFTGMSSDAVRQLYLDKGYKLSDDQHRSCNNCCEFGPHVVEGGSCFVPPTPGTPHYEAIATGTFRQTQTIKK